MYAPRDGDLWKPADIAQLRALAGKYSVERIALMMGRTPGAVRWQAYLHRISLDQGPPNPFVN